MKYFLALLFVIRFFVVFGQQYHKCEIYQYSANDSNKKEHICTQQYNNQGKIILETWYTGSQGICEYFYNDTILTTSTERFSKPYGKDPLMSTRTNYYYDDKGLLTKKIMIPHQAIDSPRNFICDDCEDPNAIAFYTKDTTVYIYTSTGKVKEEWHYMDGFNEHSNFAYDDCDRLLIDSAFRNKEYYSSVINKYNNHGYASFRFHDQNQDTTDFVYTEEGNVSVLDEKGKYYAFKTLRNECGLIIRKMYYEKDDYPDYKEKYYITWTKLYIYE